VKLLTPAGETVNTAKSGRLPGVRLNRRRTHATHHSRPTPETPRGRARQLAAIDRQDRCLDFEPVVKLFTTDGNATWLLTKLNPDFDHLAFGLCDLGLGEPELGYVSLHELGPLGLPLERDLYFAPTPYDCGLRRSRPRTSADHHLISCRRSRASAWDRRFFGGAHGS
jgi:Protein of unknown function (DUF2958)